MDPIVKWLISFGILLMIVCLISMVVCFFQSRQEKEGYFEFIFDSSSNDTDNVWRTFSRIGIVIFAIGLVIGVLIFIHNSIFK